VITPARGVIFGTPTGARRREGLVVVMLSTLSPHGMLVAETSSWPWILVFAVMVVAGIAAAVALKKS
jgi:hypothetical protein